MRNDSQDGSALIRRMLQSSKWFDGECLFSIWSSVKCLFSPFLSTCRHCNEKAHPPNPPSLPGDVSATIPLAVAEPLNACLAPGEALKARHGHAIQGSVLLAARGDCSFLDKAISADKAGARAILVFNGGRSGAAYPQMAAPLGRGQAASGVRLAAGSIPWGVGAYFLRAAEVAEEVGRALRGTDFGKAGTEQELPPAVTAALVALAARAGAFVTPRGIEVATDGRVRLSVVSVAPGSRGRDESVAEFSAFGPSLDGRIKPDLLAPGEAVRSAAGVPSAGPHCGTAILSGTSMSAGIVGGAAALVRQFFR